MSNNKIFPGNIENEGSDILKTVPYISSCAWPQKCVMGVFVKLSLKHFVFCYLNESTPCDSNIFKLITGIFRKSCQFLAVYIRSTLKNWFD